MRKVIVTLTTDNGGDREDGNVYYAESILVSNEGRPSLEFSEPIFTATTSLLVAVEGGYEEGGYEDAIKAIRDLGYSVERLEQIIVACAGSIDDDEEDCDDE